MPIKKTTTSQRSLSPIEQAKDEFDKVNKKIKSLQFLISAYELSPDFPQEMKDRHIQDIKEDIEKAIKKKDEAAQDLENKILHERNI